MNTKIPKINLFLFCLILSCILHTFFYKVFIQYSELQVTSHSPHYISIQLSKPKLNSKKQNSEIKKIEPNKISRERVMVSAVKPRNDGDIMPRNEGDIMPQNNGDNSSQKSKLVTKRNNNVTPSVFNFLNFIQGVKLPQNLLGQNLFPRTYKIEFEFQINENHVSNIILKNFSPMHTQLKYLDRIVQNSFLKKLHEVSTGDLEKILTNFDRIQNSNSSLNGIHKVILIIDFIEKN